MGVGVGVDPSDDVQRLGWVDAGPRRSRGEKRQIRVFTRHYQAAMTLAEQKRPDRDAADPGKAMLKQRSPTGGAAGARRWPFRRWN